LEGDEGVAKRVRSQGGVEKRKDDKRTGGGNSVISVRGEGESCPKKSEKKPGEREKKRGEGAIGFWGRARGQGLDKGRGREGDQGKGGEKNNYKLPTIGSRSGKIKKKGE